jgi:hypothetical protein
MMAISEMHHVILPWMARVACLHVCIVVIIGSQMKSDVKPLPDPWLTTSGRTAGWRDGRTHMKAEPRGPANHLSED